MSMKPTMNSPSRKASKKLGGKSPRSAVGKFLKSPKIKSRGRRGTARASSLNSAIPLLKKPSLKLGSFKEVVETSN